MKFSSIFFTASVSIFEIYLKCGKFLVLIAIYTTNPPLKFLLFLLFLVKYEKNLHFCVTNRTLLRYISRKRY